MGKKQEVAAIRRELREIKQMVCSHAHTSFHRETMYVPEMSLYDPLGMGNGVPQRIPAREVCDVCNKIIRTFKNNDEMDEIRDAT